MTQNPNEQRSVAYLSMEIGIDERICTYSGGLGVLAGDTIRSVADLKVPMLRSRFSTAGVLSTKVEATDGNRRAASWALRIASGGIPASPVLVE
jgi:starch phosphorylase